MPMLTGLLNALFDHMLVLMPDPAEAKRLDDIIDLDDGIDRSPRPLVLDAGDDPRSAVRPSTLAPARRAAS